MNEIYIVEGSTGEYSDHCEWAVAAYFSKEKAQEHVLKASARERELIAEKTSYWDVRGGNEYDPNMQVDYTGVNYTCYPVKILDSPQPSNE